MVVIGVTDEASASRDISDTPRHSLQTDRASRSAYPSGSATRDGASPAAYIHRGHGRSPVAQATGCPCSAIADSTRCRRQRASSLQQFRRRIDSDRLASVPPALPPDLAADLERTSKRGLDGWPHGVVPRRGLNRADQQTDSQPRRGNGRRDALTRSRSPQTRGPAGGHYLILSSPEVLHLRAATRLVR
jgi:hypothetical protein